METELDQTFKQETVNEITAMGNLLDLDIVKDQQNFLSETLWFLQTRGLKFKSYAGQTDNFEIMADRTSFSAI
jgi:hypothetical protein